MPPISSRPLSFGRFPIAPLREALQTRAAVGGTARVILEASDAPAVMRLRSRNVAILTEGSPRVLRAETAHCAEVPAGMIFVARESDAVLASFPHLSPDDCLVCDKGQRATFLVFSEREFKSLRGFPGLSPFHTNILHLLLAFPELAKNPLVTDDHLRALASAAVLKPVSKDEVLIEQDTADDERLWVVTKGLFTVARREDRKIAWMVNVGDGQPLGEGGFLGGTRNAYVLATEASEVLELDRQSAPYLRINEQIREVFEDALRRIQSERANSGGRLGKAVPTILTIGSRYGINFSMDHALRVSELLEPVIFPTNTRLMQKGQKDAGDLFIIVCGQVAVDRRGRNPIILLGPGDILGEHSFMTGEARSADAFTRKTPVLAYKLSAARKGAIEKSVPEFLQILEQLSQERQLF